MRLVTFEAVADMFELSAVTDEVTGTAGVALEGDKRSVGPVLLFPKPSRQIEDFLVTVGVVADVGDGGTRTVPLDLSDLRDEVNAENRVIVGNGGETTFCPVESNSGRSSGSRSGS